MKHIPKIFDYTLYALLIALPFSKALPNIFLALLVVLLLLRYKEFKHTKVAGPVLLLYGSLVLYLSLKAVINTTFLEDFKLYEKHFIVFALSIILSFYKEDIAKIKYSIIISVSLAAYISIGRLILYCIEIGSFSFANGDDINSILLLERPYMGFFLLVNIILLAECYNSLKKYRTAIIANIGIMCLFLIVLSARLSFATLVLLIFVYIFFYLKMNAIKKAALLAGVAVICFTGIALNRNFIERLFIKEDLEKTIEFAQKAEPRVLIWGCAYTISQDDFNILTGEKGYKILENKLVACYADNITNDDEKKQYYIDSKFNTHNTFLDFFMVGGLIALLLFCAFMLYSCLAAVNNFYTMALAISLILFLFFENLFHRQLGCYIFSIFVFIVNYRKIETSLSK